MYFVISFGDEKRLLDEVYDAMEIGFFILGISGVEDKLQDKVGQHLCYYRCLIALLCRSMS
jgi:hypothetical protein